VECSHDHHVRDPSDNSLRKPSLVCLACGIIGTTCDVCDRFYAVGPFSYIPEEWCRNCDCCPSCCTTPDSSLTPADIARAIDLSVRRVTDDHIRETIRAAPTRDEAITAARKLLSLGGMSSLGFSLSGFRDRVNKGRGLTVQFGHRSGVVTWAQVADYVLAGDAAMPTVAAQQLSLFG
jgi:hypothetical protein